jgi:SAM-dependent methyltransferase
MYDDVAYLGPSLIRLESYRHQLLYALRDTPRTALVIGVGDRLVADLLERAGVTTSTVDIESDLEPDIVASVESMPLPDNAVDVSICSQVLEHLPFERFEPALSELRRVTRHRVVLSVPDMRRFVSLRLHMPKVHIDRQFSIPRFRPGRIPPGRGGRSPHQWEIDFTGTRFGTVRRAIERSGWRIAEVRRVSDLFWHTFFLLEK